MFDIASLHQAALTSCHQASSMSDAWLMSYAIAIYALEPV